MHELDRAVLNRGWTIPAVYGNDRLVLLPREPHWVFAYWETTPALREQLRAEYGAAWDHGTTVLQIQDLDRNMSRDYPVETESGSFHAPAEEAGNRYLARLGRRLADGRFILLATSNIVRTPRDSISTVLDPRWRSFAFWKHRFFRRMVVGLSSYELFDHDDYIVFKEADRD